MTRTWRAAMALAAGILAAGCASTPSHTQPQNPPAAAPLSPATSVTSPGGTWAAIPMGGSGPNQFWQLFLLPAPGGRWSLQTPPDIATNGALILAAQDGPSQDGATLTTGVRPSLDLTYSPVTTTRDGGRSWTTLLPDAGLANAPDALAAAPGGQLIALSQHNQVSLARPGSSWATLTTESTLAATPAARSAR